jgi:hypothetical protein
MMDALYAGIAVGLGVLLFTKVRSEGFSPNAQAPGLPRADASPVGGSGATPGIDATISTAPGMLPAHYAAACDTCGGAGGENSALIPGVYNPTPFAASPVQRASGQPYTPGAVPIVVNKNPGTVPILKTPALPSGIGTVRYNILPAKKVSMPKPKPVRGQVYASVSGNAGSGVRAQVG